MQLIGFLQVARRVIAPPLRKLPRPQWLHLLSSHIGPEVASLREPLWEPIEPFEVGGEGARAREDQPCPCRACMCGFHQASSEDDSICPPLLLDLMWTSCTCEVPAGLAVALGIPNLAPWKSQVEQPVTQSPQIQTRPELAIAWLFICFSVCCLSLAVLQMLSDWNWPRQELLGSFSPG